MLKVLANYWNGYAENEKSKKNLLFFCICCVFFSMLILNFLTGYKADDYTYMGSESFIDAIKLEYNQYMTWNGRSVAHLLLRNFLMIPKEVFNIINAFVYTLLTYLMYLFCNNKKTTKVSLYLFIISCCFIFIPVFGETVLWVTGAANYLWTTTIIVAFLLPYKKYLHGESNFWESSKAAPFLMFFTGIIAGWCNENTSGGAILFIILLLVYLKMNKLKIKLWHMAGFLGMVVGFLFMILAPGNLIRAESSLQGSLFEFATRIGLVAFISSNIFTELIILFFSFLVLYILSKNTKSLILSSIIFIVGIATASVMVFSPEIPSRAFTGAAIFLIIAVTHLVFSFDVLNIINKKIVYILTAIMFVSYLSLFITAAFDISFGYYVYITSENYVQEKKGNGNLDNILVPKIPSVTRFNSISDASQNSEDSDHWVNRAYAQYHGINSVIGIPYDEWIKQTGNHSIVPAHLTYEEWMKEFEN